MRLPALLMALALACGGPALAAGEHDGSAGSAATSTHQVASGFKDALHKLGAATRHALQRADAAMHRMVHHDRTA